MRPPSLLLLALLVAAPAAAQAPTATEGSSPASSTATGARSLRAAPATGPIRLDGRMDEAAWAAAEAATEFTESYPNAGGPARQRTEARVLFADGALLVGVRMFDAHPDSIAAQLARRDATGIFSDWVHVIIDSYHDRRTAFRFSVNPRGVKRDVFHFNDGNEDGGWDAVWEVGTAIDSLGWTAEYRIPLSQLRFATAEPAGGRVWGLQVMRDIARNESRDSWSAWTRDDNGFVSRFGTLTGLSGLGNPRRLELRPYTVAKLSRAPDADAGRNPFYRASDPGMGFGGDVQYGITSNLTLTATFNPDFGQVEADPSQVNLTANEAFFSEQRPFFLEGMDLFRFGLGLGNGGGEQLFYSRRIGRLPQRRLSVPAGGFRDAAENTTILGAVKLTGRTPGGWALGMLSAVTAEEELAYRLPDDPQTQRAPVEPLTNYTVGRVRRDLRGGDSQVGAIVTATHRRIDDPALAFLPDAAYAGGFDARHRFAGGRWEANAWLLGSLVRGDTLAIQRRQLSPLRHFQRPDAEHVEYDPTRTSLSGMAAKAGISKVSGSWRAGSDLTVRSPGFEVTDAGFQNEADMVLLGGYTGYQQNQAGRLFRSWSLFTNGFGGSNWAGDRQFTGFNVNGNFQLKNLWNGWAGIERSLDNVSSAPLRGGPLMRRPGAVNAWAGLNTDRRKKVQFSVDGSGWMEDDTDGHSYNVGTSVTWRPSARMDLSLRPSLYRSHGAWQYVATRTDAATGERRYVFSELDQNTASLTARLNYTFTPELTLQLYAQPFVAAGEYRGFQEVADPRARDFGERLRPLGDEVRPCDGEYGVRPTADGCGDGAGFAYTFGRPDFNVREFRTNAVLRWEYRPGSALFVVWQQNRSGFDPDGRFRLGRNAETLFREPATNVFQVKATYWIGG